MRYWAVWCGLVVAVMAADTIYVPTESYLSFSTFLEQRSAASPPLDMVVPSDWVAIAATAPVIGRYVLPSQAQVAISQFDGDIGSDLANLNRWRRQVGLPPVDTASDMIITQESDYTLKYAALGSGASRMSVYWLNQGARHFFIKLTPMTVQDNDAVANFVKAYTWF